MTETTNTEEIIDKAHAEGAFDVLSFIGGTAYPTSRVVLFSDVVSAKKLKEISTTRIQYEIDNGEPLVDEKLDAEIATLTEAVRKSSLIVELRGMPPGIVRDIVESEKDDVPDFVDNEIVAKTIVRVSNHEGVSDDRLWDYDAVRELRRFLNEGEVSKLLNAVMEVNFNSAVFDEATDAGFLSRSANLVA